MCKKICNKHGFDYLGTFYVAQREVRSDCFHGSSELSLIPR